MIKMTDVSTINVVNDDVSIVQVGSGNVVHNIPSDMTLNMKLRVDSSERLTNVSPSFNIYLGNGTGTNRSSETFDKAGIKVKVTDSTTVSEVKYNSPDDTKFCGCRLTKKAVRILSGLFTRKYTYGCSCGERRDSLKIMDRLKVVLEPGDVVLNAGTFVLYMGDGFIVKLDHTTGILVKLKLDLKSEFEKWEMWNSGTFCDYFTPSERVGRARGLVDSIFGGDESDFIAWCFTGMDWTEASENGYKLYCR